MTIDLGGGGSGAGHLSPEFAFSDHPAGPLALQQGLMTPSPCMSSSPERRLSQPPGNTGTIFVSRNPGGSGDNASDSYGMLPSIFANIS